jgi:gamma-glutamyltranspeptidase/glutathione hydrolase
LAAQEAIALGLVYAPGPVATLETGTGAAALQPALAALGERTQVAPLGLKANAIEWKQGRWVGAADPRSEGVAIGEDGSVSDPTRMAPVANRPSE